MKFIQIEQYLCPRENTDCKYFSWVFCKRVNNTQYPILLVWLKIELFSLFLKVILCFFCRIFAASIYIDHSLHCAHYLIFKLCIEKTAICFYITSNNLTRTQGTHWVYIRQENIYDVNIKIVQKGF